MNSSIKSEPADDAAKPIPVATQHVAAEAASTKKEEAPPLKTTKSQTIKEVDLLLQKVGDEKKLRKYYS